MIRICFTSPSERGGTIRPMEKGLAAPLRRTREFGSLNLCKGAESTLLENVSKTLSSSVPLRTICGSISVFGFNPEVFGALSA